MGIEDVSSTWTVVEDNIVQLYPELLDYKFCLENSIKHCFLRECTLASP